MGINFKKIFFTSLILLFLLNIKNTFPAYAASGLLPACDLKQGDRQCQIDDFLILGVNLIRFMLGIAGSLALLFFIYGGFTWLISAGNSEKVQHGKDILTAAAVGILVVLASWMAINFIYTSLGASNIEWWQTKKTWVKKNN